MTYLAENNGYWSFAYQNIYTYFLLWQATQDTKWCTMAWDNSIRPVIFVNGDPNQGYLALIDKYGGDPHAAAFAGGQFLGNFPIALDWGYDCLNSFQKASIVEWVYRETIAMTSNGYWETYLRNDGTQIWFFDGALNTYSLYRCRYRLINRKSFCSALWRRF